jgi:acyl-CoA synthetase (AMP-forming)/AMP-acid ligase II
VEAATIPAAIAHAAWEFADQPALAEPGGPRITYGELHERVVTVARALIAEGVGPGDRVAIWSPNTHHWVLGALGALHAGAASRGRSAPASRPGRPTRRWWPRAGRAGAGAARTG